NAPVTGSNGLIQYEVVFTLSGLPEAFNPRSGIADVILQYGTSLADPAIPEPGTLGLLVMGFLALLRRRSARLYFHT
ncbi:MAG: PEP-CTERM sorting domain-containing protein, partial [Phycisphaerae bacterium]